MTQTGMVLPRHARYQTIVKQETDHGTRTSKYFSHLMRLLIAILILAFNPGLHIRAQAQAPNVILIMTDNQGAWTLGCYGNPEIRTPQIDRIAQEGIRFTRCFSSNPVCSPTRATYLTGLIPSQHGVHCWLTGGRLQIGPEARNTIEEFRSLPEILAGSGYVCGLSGKWHLGDNLHPQEKFSYWVTKPHGHTATFYDAEIIEGGRIRKEPQYLTDFWADHAIRFIEKNRDRPFFLFLAFNGPYGLGASLMQPARNRHAAYYADKPMVSFPRNPPHPWLRQNREFINNLQAMRRYAAEISGVDDAVGRVMESVRKLGLDQKTLVIFTADQGLAGGQNGMWGMGDHSRPLHAYDSTIHIPMIWRHPGSIQAGRQSNLLISNYDFFPTLLSYLGLAEEISNRATLPGRDFSAALRDQPLSWENAVFFEFENTRSIRTGDWKYTRRFPAGPDELYHLERDPGEWENLAGRKEYQEVQQQLHRKLESFFKQYADPQYDLWQGGRSKTHLLSASEFEHLPAFWSNHDKPFVDKPLPNILP